MNRDFPFHLRSASRTTQHPRSVLGPTLGAEGRIEAYLRQLDVLFAKIEEAGGHQRLFEHLGETVEQMRIEGESRRAKAGLPNAYDALPSVREAQTGAA